MPDLYQVLHSFKVISVRNISENRGEVLLNAQLGLYAFAIFRYAQENQKLSKHKDGLRQLKVIGYLSYYRGYFCISVIF